MTPIDFLKALWPAEGIYCLAIPRGKGGAYKHWTFATIEEAAAQAAKAASYADVYFNIHTLRERQVPSLTDPAKTQVRVQRNMVAARCFFFDLDIGADVNKYGTREEALAGLKKFVADTQLPPPMVTSSGGGFHVYWRLVDPIPTEEWRDHATHLRQLASHHGLKFDRSRTTDTASVLRVAGTFNRKDPLAPRPVEVLHPGVETGTGVFLKALNDAIIRANVTPAAAPKLAQAESLLGSNTDMPYDGPNPTAGAVFTACQQVRRIAELKGQFSEPEWYRIAIGVGRFIEGGNRIVHRLSSGHPGYSEAACNAKIHQNELSQKGPSSCASVASVSALGDSPCQTCPFQGKVYGPIQAALYKDPAPPPVHMELVGEIAVEVAIPDPPAPYLRLKNGAGIAVVTKNADGSEEPIKIYDYDLYPIRRLSNEVHGVEEQLWHVCLPNGEARDVTLTADTLYDLRKFASVLPNHGMYIAKGNLSYLQEYMVAYIAQLQKLARADAQCNHLGWADDHRQFILPDKILLDDGGVRPSQLGLGAQRASNAVERKGSLAEQVQLLKFYNHPAYFANQCFILAGLAAPIFYATGHHGIVVNASGDAGASKSTSLYAAASLWGQPEMYPINGTNNGATVRGRNERMTVLANLPICVDEITNMPVRDAIDLAMGVTQPGHRIRLQTDGVERAAIGSYKATIMLTTANNSLHNTLSLDNAAGTAGSMRVFEMKFVARNVHKKHEADDFLRQLKENYGHIGPAFMAQVVKHRAKVEARIHQVMKEIDEAAEIRASERFWGAYAATVIVAGEFARALGLLDYNVEAIRRWLLDYQIPQLRGIVAAEYSDPLSIVATYLEMNNASIISMRKGHAGNISNVIHAPRGGALLAHYDLDENMLYVMREAFKQHCQKIGANSTKVIEDLHAPRDGLPIIPQMRTRRILGAGTEHAKAQVWCFAVNMAHPAVSGVADLKIVQGGGQGGEAAKPSLTVVQ